MELKDFKNIWNIKLNDNSSNTLFKIYIFFTMRRKWWFRLIALMTPSLTINDIFNIKIDIKDYNLK